MRRGIVAILSLLLVLSSLLAGCGGSKSSGSAGSDQGKEPAPAPKEAVATIKDPVTISIWSWRPQDEELWKKVQEKLQAQGDKVTIEFRGVKSTDYDAVLQTSMAGEQGPDLFTTRGGAGTRKYAEANQISPLEAIKLDGFDKGILGQVSHDGKVYAVPFAVQTLTFFYNTEIFEKNGIKEPATWDELVKSMEALKAKGITPIAIGGKDGYALNLLVDAIGATHLGDQWAQEAIDGKTNFADPKFVDVLKRINDLKQYAQKDFMATAQRDARAMFALGQTAMILDGIWAVETYYLKTNPAIKLGSFLAPPLKAGEPTRLYAYVDGGYAVNSKSKAKEAAMKVAAFTATAEFAQMYADLNAEIPGNGNVKFPDSKPMLKKAVDEKNAKALKVLFRIRSPFDAGAPDISTSLGANLQGMLSDKITPEQAAQNVQKDLASWYPAFKK